MAYFVEAYSSHPEIFPSPIFVFLFLLVVPPSTVAKILFNIDFTSLNFDSNFIILVFKFEILRTLSLNKTDNNADEANIDIVEL